jgi:hypothetical protein
LLSRKLRYGHEEALSFETRSYKQLHNNKAGMNNLIIYKNKSVCFG